MNMKISVSLKRLLCIMITFLGYDYLYVSEWLSPICKTHNVHQAIQSYKNNKIFNVKQSKRENSRTY